eukprot:1241045-Amphidinium_carterae.1
MVNCITAELVLPRDEAQGHVTELQRRQPKLDVNTSWIIRIYSGERPALLIETRDVSTYKASIEKCWTFEPAERPSSEVVAQQHLDRVKKLRFKGLAQNPEVPARTHLSQVLAQKLADNFDFTRFRVQRVKSN